ncbi:hypothetical protein TVAG_004040 [Trichomonas vaginalis G3]|uniref:RRM domain-containing protein n=1 Tax=Trichomonas vaginalis (strain ATCC PRA-98 / G3) TaxID=412133 RepID=A2E5B8_TRIV3|nr:RNA binding [Trichomonas vaginalis G3]EAY12198.1 hypothetical protein TVAG_004040 [Trichomonas vaginalis G3]KAI5515402.1 RNA binding [Trichomonas vaginalis G3]|eukprot:XP_001324421.1 hypothetical protein [Trichomonas vaginalis G3]
MNEDDDMMKDLLKLEYEAKLIDKAENQFIKKEESTVVGQQESTNTFAERFQKRQEFKKKIRDSTKVSPTFLREDAGKVWNDASLSEWPENDYRIMVLGLHQACTDDKLYDAFKHYKSIVKAHVVHDTSNRGKHYGFVSLMDVNDYIKAMKEMDGGFVENAKVHLQPSKWKDKSLKK